MVYELAAIMVNYYSLVNLVQYQDITTDIFHLILVCSKQKKVNMLSQQVNYMRQVL